LWIRGDTVEIGAQWGDLNERLQILLSSSIAKVGDRFADRTWDVVTI